jgi:hypothetical protein
MDSVPTAFKKSVLILPSACSVAVCKLWMKVMVIHRGGYPQFYHRVIGRA